MLWIALRPHAPPDASSRSHEAAAPAPEQLALAWWALQFSPRVCVQEEAVLLELSASLRLFGGQRALLQRLRDELPGAPASSGGTGLAVAPTATAALALLRTLPPSESGALVPAVSCTARRLSATLDALPLILLSAARAQEEVLARLGCRTLGDVRALPRDGLARRFGAPLLEAMDQAYGVCPEVFAWVELPETFNARLECPGRIEAAEGMLFGARRLLGQLAGWLLARQRGVQGITLHWEHDLMRRGDLQHGQLALRTAEATRDMTHLARLLAEHLARIRLPAPVQALRLQATETEALQIPSASLLPEDVKKGDSLSQLIERLSARLGAERVLRGQLLTDHRPQHMQTWVPAIQEAVHRKAPALPAHVRLHPPWLLPVPLRLPMQGERPLYQGPLIMLAGPERLESGWWSLLSSAEREGEELALRDYYVARSPQAGLLWVYRRRSAGEPAWFLQGVYG